MMSQTFLIALLRDCWVAKALLLPLALASCTVMKPLSDPDRAAIRAACDVVFPVHRLPGSRTETKR